MSISSFLNENYAFVFVLAILVFNIISNKETEKKIRWIFIAIVGFTIVQSIVVRAIGTFAVRSEPSAEEMLAYSIGYIIRPLLLYLLLLIVLRYESERKKILFILPLTAFAVSIFLNPVFGMIYSFSSSNEHVKGAFFFITYLILIIYIALIVFYNFKYSSYEEYRSESITIHIGAFFIIADVIAEIAVKDFSGQFETAIILAALSYSIYFRTREQFVEKKILETREMRTGLLNEHACVDRLNSMRNTPKLTEYAAVYFDLVRFGAINDQYGMETGNKVLTEYTVLLSHAIQKDEFLSRPGSDHFIAVIYKENLKLFLAQLENMPVIFELDGEDYDIPVSACCGVYEIDDSDINGEDIISNAYAALNYGKSIAKRSVTYLTGELLSSLKEQRQLEVDIPQAMAREEFLVYYQPKVNSKKQVMCGAEALVRWLHDGNIISPGKFIPIMESNNMMCDLDFYILRRVCTDISEWISQGLVPPTISVNFSRRNLSNPNLAKDIDRVVTSYHVPKKMIEIEITETIDEFPISVLGDFVDDLHNLGYKVAVDDFGSGSSSLSLLREVTFDTLKIDKGFVDRAYAKDLTILNYMIKLAIALDIEVLAEGVELKEQVETLSLLGCDIIQGYYYDKPLPKDIFTERIINRRYTDE